MTIPSTQPSILLVFSAFTAFTAGNATALSTHSAQGCFIPGEAPLLRGRRPQQIQYLLSMIDAGAEEYYSIS